MRTFLKFLKCHLILLFRAQCIKIRIRYSDVQKLVYYFVKKKVQIVLFLCIKMHKTFQILFFHHEENNVAVELS